MVTCPVCMYEKNKDDALKCESCTAPLPDNRKSLLHKPTALLAIANLPADPRVRNIHIGKISRAQIALYVADVEEPLIVTLTHDLLMGRYGGVDVDAPAHIDLAPFGALEAGVSRKHAVLRRLGPDAVIVDLDSTNGTWLNGVRLTPNQPVTLRSGDRIMLSRLFTQVYLPDES